MNGVHPGLLAKATARNGAYYFAPQFALAVITEARQHGIPLLGIEGFILGEGYVQPSIDDIADYSGAADPYLDAYRFIEERANKGLYFEFTLGE